MFRRKKGVKKVFALLLCVFLLLSFSACSQSSVKKYNMTFSENKTRNTMRLGDNDVSENIFISKDDAKVLLNTINNTTVEFPYSDLFETDNCYSRLETQVYVKEHDSIFKSISDINATALLNRVKENNINYLEINTFGYETPEDEDILTLTKLIVDVFGTITNNYPAVDTERVLCNLSELKILYKKGMVDNAQVTADMVLNISPNMFEIVDIMAGENGCRNVVIHEVMHIIQMGCKCEDIEHCTRRCGVSYRWDDFELNSTDFNWLFEGSAERMMCNLTGDDALTYKYMINYICTMNLSTIADEKVPANYLETLSFYDNIDLIYELFECKSVEEKKEILNLFIAINIIQTAPEEFLQVYGDNNNIDINDSNKIDELNYTLKPAACLVMTKTFYRNLIEYISSNNPITTNDFMYLINLFEASIDNHLRFTNTALDKYNREFCDAYLIIRDSLFSSVSANNGIEIDKLYKDYAMLLDENTVNASLKAFSEDKIAFLLGRTYALEYSRDSKIYSK